MARKQSRSRNEPDVAKPCDLKELARPNATRKRRERLEYLFASGKRPTDSGPIPSEEEQAFWREQFRQNPFLLCRHGAFVVKTKEKGYQRYFPNDAQLSVIEWREYCWAAGIVADILVLKCRQDGMSTEGILSLLAMSMAIGECYAHIVGHEKKNNHKMLRIARVALAYLPPWLRPDDKCVKDSTSEGVFEIDDPEKDLIGIQFQTDTAAAGETIGRGDPAQFRHYTEIDWWGNQEEAMSALSAQQVWSFPAAQTRETTGKKSNSSFHSAYKNAKIPNENYPGRKAFFFPWYSHKEYRRPLPPRLSAVDFWEQMLPEERLRFESHGCDTEQANWYLCKKEEHLGNRAPLDLFRREFPFDEQEAFLGGEYRVFDAEKLTRATDIAGRFKARRLKDLALTAAPKDIPPDWNPSFAKCKIEWKPESDGAPKIVDYPGFGELHVWEHPRRGHSYAIIADIAENKLVTPGVIESGDWSVIDVVRLTHDPRCDEPILLQVAQLRSKTIQVQDLAKAAVALSKCYRSEGDWDSKINFERNAGGLAFEMAVKQYGGRMYLHVRKDGIKDAVTGYGIQVSTGQQGVGSKNKLVADLQTAIAEGAYRQLSEDSLLEMGAYTRNEKGIYGAPAGDHDDTVSVAYLGIASAKDFNRGNAISKAVKADGDLNLADQPPDDEIETAHSDFMWKKHKPKSPQGTVTARRGGWGKHGV